MTKTVEISPLVEAIDLTLADKRFAVVGPCGPRLAQRAADAIKNLRQMRYCFIDIFKSGDRYRVTSLHNLLADGAWNSAAPVRRYIQLGQTFGWMITADNAKEIEAVAMDLATQANQELAERRR